MLKKIWVWLSKNNDKDECSYYVEPKVIRVVERPTRNKIIIKRKKDVEDR